MYSVQHAACWPRPQIAAQGQAAGPRGRLEAAAPPRPGPGARRSLWLTTRICLRITFSCCAFVTLSLLGLIAGNPPASTPCGRFLLRTSEIAAPWSGYGTTLCRLPQQREERNRHRITPTEGVERDAMAGFIVTQAGHEQTVVQLGALPKTHPAPHEPPAAGGRGGSGSQTPLSGSQHRRGRASGSSTHGRRL